MHKGVTEGVRRIAVIESASSIGAMESVKRIRRISMKP